MDKGELVPDSVVIGLVKERLGQDDCGKGYILDGFPRNTAQAEALDGVLATMNSPLTVALSVDVDKNDLMKRLTGRRTCKGCQQMFNIHFTPPKKEGVCDRCGGELYQRPDDTPETQKHRIEVYFEQTAPLINFYRDRGLLVEVDGRPGIDEIQAELLNIVRGL